jgi:hypothetical protein
LNQELPAFPPIVHIPVFIGERQNKLTLNCGRVSLTCDAQSINMLNERLNDKMRADEP